MRRTALLLFLLALSVSALGQEIREERNAWRTARALSHPVARRQALLEFADRFPASTFAPGALLEVARLSTRAPVAKELGAGALRRLAKRFPGYLEQHAYDFETLLDEFLDLRFTLLPAAVKSGIDRVVPREGAETPRTFRFLRCPPDAWRGYLESDAPLDSGTADPPEELHRPFTSVTLGAGESAGDLSLPAEPGHYLVVEEVEGFRRVSGLRVVPVAILALDAGKDLAVLALDPETGRPVAGVGITVRSRSGRIEGRTDTDGVARFRVPTPLLVTGEGEGWVDGVSLDWGSSPDEDLAYITTDRPLYRPNQEVHYKVVGRRREGGRLALPRRSAVRVELRGPEGRLLASQTRRFGGLGTIHGSFPLGDEPPLGRYAIVVDVPTLYPPGDDGGVYLPEDLEGRWRTAFRVAEYRKPEVLLSVAREGPSEDGRIPAILTLTHASGGALRKAPVSWSVTGVQDDRSEATVNGLEGDPRWWFFRPRGPEWWTEEEEIASGEGTTDGEGRLRIAIPTWPGAREYRIRAFVTDAAGLEHETRGTIADEAGEGRLALRIPRPWARAGERFPVVAIWRAAPDRPLAGRPLRLFISPEYDPKTAKVLDGTTGAKGEARFDVDVPDTDGLWLRVVPRDADPDDERGAELDLDVVGGDLPEDEILVHPDRFAYEPGETARLLLRTAAVPLTAWLTVEAGTLRTSRIVTLEKPEQFLDVPVLPGDAPELRVRLLGFRKGESVVGGAALPVFPRTRILSVTVTPARSEVRPGDPVAVTVTTATAEGEPVSAEVELALVDEAIYGLERDETEDIRRFFFRRPPPPEAAWGTFPVWDPVGGYGFWFGEEEMVPTFGAEESEGGEGFAPTAVRRRFLDTWHYDARVTTGMDGRATVRLTAPDTLTRWRILARAVAGADHFGEGASRIVTKKRVVVRLSAPRFLVAGDEGTVSLLVRNGLPQTAEFEVALAGTGILLQDHAEKLTIPAGGEARVDRGIRAMRPGIATLTAKALSTVESDAMERSIPVRPRGVPIRERAAGIVHGRYAHTFHLPEDAHPGTAKLKVSVGTPVTAIRQALPTLAGYPYGCVEQTMSRFLPSVVAGRTLRRLGIPDETLEKTLPDMVAKGLMRLYRFQHEDGGWGWWETDETDEGMTAYVVFGLALARSAGYEVDEGTLQRGRNALAGMTPTPFALYARHVAGDETAGRAEVRADSDADRAWLVLAGRKGLAEGIRGEAASVRDVAVVLRALHAADPEDPRIDPLLERLLLSRRGAAWETTVDSAFAVYALAETVTSATAPRYETKIPSPLKHGPNRLEVVSPGKEPLFVSAELSWFAGQASPRPGALTVSRRIERLVRTGQGLVARPLASGDAVRVGEELRVVLTLGRTDEARYVLVESPLAAGTEAWPERGDDRDPWFGWNDRREYRDDRVAVAAARISGGEEFAFRLKATHPGLWWIGPAVAWPMYLPERRGFSRSFTLRVTR